MGYYTCVILLYRGEKYFCCHRDGFENWCEKAIRLIIDEFMVYKDYIKNMLQFLNIDRSKNVDADFWPKWDNYGNFESDQFYWIDITTDKIYVDRNGDLLYNIKIEKIITPEFIEFINRRYLLKSICKKYNLPKDIHAYLINFF